MSLNLIRSYISSTALLSVLLLIGAIVPNVVSAEDVTILRSKTIAVGYTMWNESETFAVGVQPDGIRRKKSPRFKTRLELKAIENVDKYPDNGNRISDPFKYKLGKDSAKRLRVRKKLWVTLSYPVEYAEKDLVIKYWHPKKNKWRKLPTSNNAESARVNAKIRRKSAVLAVFKKPVSLTDVGTGQASWYDGTGAAHNDIPIGSPIRVTNLANGKYVDTYVAGTGPFIPGRVVDLSRDDFAAIASLSTGVISVRVEVIEE